MLRQSVGIEHVDDLLGDIEEAMKVSPSLAARRLYAGYNHFFILILNTRQCMIVGKGRMTRNVRKVNNSV